MRKVKLFVAVMMTASILFTGCSSDKKDTVTTEEVLQGSTQEVEKETTQEVTEENITAVETTEEESTEEETKSFIVTEENLVEKYASFDVTSENINNGVWDDVISDTSKGENKSPQLSWEPVEGAEVYAIYMVDVSMQHFIHWKSYEVTETELPLGWAAERDYVGPWPPEGGEHVYDVYVIAMKKPVERMKGGVNSATERMQKFIDDADTDAEGNTGNIIACGHLTATFKH